jgi:hypothetical protein
MQNNWTAIIITGVVASVILSIIVAADLKSTRVYEAKMQCAELGYVWTTGVCNPYVIERNIIPLGDNQ